MSSSARLFGANRAWHDSQLCFPGKNTEIYCSQDFGDYVLPTFFCFDFIGLGWHGAWKLKTIHGRSSIYSLTLFFVEDCLFCLDLKASTVWLNRVWHDNRLCSFVKIKNASNFYGGFFCLQDYPQQVLTTWMTWHHSFDMAFDWLGIHVIESSIFAFG